MPHIPIRDGLPGIRGLMDFDPEAGELLSRLAQLLLRRTEGLSPGERELIATHVSTLNECRFCASSHGAAARQLLGDDAPLTPRMKALLHVAGKVQQGGRGVAEADVAAAREHGATDAVIHDTVLIAAAFCMYNRYVDGLATRAPEDPAAYEPMGAMLAAHGYVR